jgi:hypothetical protein
LPPLLLPVATVLRLICRLVENTAGDGGDVVLSLKGVALFALNIAGQNAAGI